MICGVLYENQLMIPTVCLFLKPPQLLSHLSCSDLRLPIAKNVAERVSRRCAILKSVGVTVNPVFPCSKASCEKTARNLPGRPVLFVYAKLDVKSGQKAKKKTPRPPRRRAFFFFLKKKKKEKRKKSPPPQTPKNFKMNTAENDL